MSRGVSQYEKCSAEVRMMQRARKVQKAAMRKRLAARDAACAENAAPVTVEERDLRNSELGSIMRIERRGFCPIAPRITHIGHD